MVQLEGLMKLLKVTHTHTPSHSPSSSCHADCLFPSFVLCVHLLLCGAAGRGAATGSKSVVFEGPFLCQQSALRSLCSTDPRARVPKQLFQCGCPRRRRGAPLRPLLPGRARRPSGRWAPHRLRCTRTPHRTPWQGWGATYRRPLLKVTLSPKSTHRFQAQLLETCNYGQPQQNVPTGVPSCALCRPMSEVPRRAFVKFVSTCVDPHLLTSDWSER